MTSNTSQDSTAQSLNGNGHVLRASDPWLALIKDYAQQIDCAQFWLGLDTAVIIVAVLVSSRRQRKGMIFRLQCLAIILAILFNTFEAARSYLEVNLIYEKSTNEKAYTVFAVSIICCVLRSFILLLSDIALGLKLMSFYPTPMYSIGKRRLVAATFILLLAARVVIECIASVALSLRYNPKYLFTTATRPWIAARDKKWLSLIRTANGFEWLLLALLNVYVTCILLVKAFEMAQRNEQLRSDGTRRCIRLIIETSLMTFMVPTLSTIVLACLLLSHPGGQLKNVVGALGSFAMNATVLFGLLATNWSTIRFTHQGYTAKRGASDMRIDLSSMLISHLVDLEADVPPSLSDQEQQEIGTAHELVSSSSADCIFGQKQAEVVSISVDRQKRGSSSSPSTGCLRRRSL